MAAKEIQKAILAHSFFPLSLTVPRESRKEIKPPQKPSAVDKTDASLRKIAWQGLEKDDKTTGLVLYHVEAPESVKTILEDIRKKQAYNSKERRVS